MSLIQAINTYFGIVIASDRRLMTTVGNETFLLTDNAKKLFLTDHGYGVTYCGAASVNGIPTEHILSKSIHELEFNLSVQQVAISLAEKLSALNSCNIILIVCGFFEGEAYVCSNNTDKPTEVTQNTTYQNENITVMYAGRNDIAEKYYRNKFDYKKFTIKDGMQFLSFINFAIASELHFAQTIQNVSLDCDILVLTEKGAFWSTGYENLLH
jgi:hypothetical protein